MTQTRRIEFYSAEHNEFFSDVITADSLTITYVALCTAYEQNQRVNVCHNDDNGHGFPDETYFDWGTSFIPTRARYLEYKQKLECAA